MRFERGKAVYDAVGLGRLSRALEVHALGFVPEEKNYWIDDRDIRMFLQGLERGDVLWELLDKYFKVSDESLFHLKFLVGNPVIRRDGMNGHLVMDLYKLRKTGDVKFQGELFVLKPPPIEGF